MSRTKNIRHLRSFGLTTVYRVMKYTVYYKTVLKYSSENKRSDFSVPLNNYKEYTDVTVLNYTSIKVG